MLSTQLHRACVRQQEAERQSRTKPARPRLGASSMCSRQPTPSEHTPGHKVAGLWYRLRLLCHGLLRPPLRTLRAYSTIQRLSLSTRRGYRHITASTRSALLPRQPSTLRTCRSCQAGVASSWGVPPAPRLLAAAPWAENMTKLAGGQPEVPHTCYFLVTRHAL